MKTNHWTVRLEPYRGAVTWTSEQSARLMATETLAAVSDLRIVALLRDGIVIDVLDHQGWMSGEPIVLSL